MVLLAVSGVFLVVGGGNMFYPYITPFLIDVAHFTPLTVAIPLAFYGLGGSIGIFFAERIGRRPAALSLNLAWAILYMALMMALINLAALTQWSMIAALALWSVGFAVVEPLYGQYIMEMASPRLRDFAGALRTTAWNLGIGGGSFIGGVLLVPLGIESLPFIGAGVLVLAAVMALVARRREHTLAN
jgi:predicted MFS family arabinose efflux permease